MGPNISFQSRRASIPYIRDRSWRASPCPNGSMTTSIPGGHSSSLAPSSAHSPLLSRRNLWRSPQSQRLQVPAGGGGGGVGKRQVFCRCARSTRPDFTLASGRACTYYVSKQDTFLPFSFPFSWAALSRTYQYSSGQGPCSPRIWQTLCVCVCVCMRQSIMRTRLPGPQIEKKKQAMFSRPNHKTIWLKKLKVPI